MNDDRRRILKLLAEGRISASEAERLIDAAEAPVAEAAPGPLRSPPKFLRVEMDADRPGRDPARVNVRVPMALLRAGVKLSYLMPQDARAQVNAAFAKHGIAFDIDKLKPENVDDLVSQLADVSIDMRNERSKVRVFCE